MARERAIANQLAKLFAATSSPIYAVDERRHIVYCNQACAGWLEVSAAELVGQRCDFRQGVTGDRLADLAAALCPPPEVFSREAQFSPHTGIVTAPHLAAPSAQRLASFLPLAPQEGEELPGVLALIQPAAADGRPLPEMTSAPAAGRLAVQLHRRLQELACELRTPFQLSRLVGESPAMRLVREQVRIAIQACSHVQIIGPEGSGREHVARTIHCGDDPEHCGPLMPLSCPLLDGELLQATVVAFLQRARDANPSHPATLLLLDVDQLNVEAQAELQAFFRLPTFDLRTIATSRRRLGELAAEGPWLPEIAIHLGGLVIELPALAKRREDIPLLCQQFIEDFNAAGGRQFSGLADATLDHLCSLPWRGDVEELAAAVREMCEQAEGPMITEADLSRRVRLMAAAAAQPSHAEATLKLDEFLEDVERELLTRALQQAQGNKAQAARLLGISRPRLLRRIAQLKLQR